MGKRREGWRGSKCEGEGSSPERAEMEIHGIRGNCLRVKSWALCACYGSSPGEINGRVLAA